MEKIIYTLFIIGPDKDYVFKPGEIEKWGIMTYKDGIHDVMGVETRGRENILELIRSAIAGVCQKENTIAENIAFVINV